MNTNVNRSTVAFAAVIVLVALRPSIANAAPALKSEAKSDIADLTQLHALIAEAVKDGKWPSEADQKKCRDAIRALVQQVAARSGVPERKLPVEFDQVEKADVGPTFKQTRVQRRFVIAGEVQATSAEDSVIFASDVARFTSVTNCIIVGKTVRFTGASNSIVIASEFVRGTGVDPRSPEEDRSIIVAGKWIRFTVADGAICHVLHPAAGPAPDEPKGFSNKAIALNSARKVIFLNGANDVQARLTDCHFVEVKSPLQK
jgi:hypothetical protein